MVFQPSVTIFAQGAKEKAILLEKEFDLNGFDPVFNRMRGETYDGFGDLFFDKNGKQYWLATFTAVVDHNYDYYRLFELDISKRIVREVTKEILGGYYTVGAPNPPYYYEDIDNDGIKDIFVFDHGKEYDPNWQNWVDYNVFFKGTPTGFVKTEIPIITTVKGYYHGHAIGDFDNDGDNDIAIGYQGIKIYKNDGKGNFTSMNVISSSECGLVTPLALKFLNADDDNDLELLAPPYRDFDYPCYRAQSKLLNYINGNWEVSNFAQQTPYLNGSVSGCAQILTFPSTKRKTPDLLYRIETFDTFPLIPNGSWLTRFYRNSENRFDTIIPVNYLYADTANVFFIDPKVVDINFDGYNDIFFKQHPYGMLRLPSLYEKIWINDGKNNFNPIPFKFSDDAKYLMYLYVKTDSIKRYSLLMSLNEVRNNNVKSLYFRMDSLVFPIKPKFNFTLCQGETITSLITKVPIKIEVTYNPKNEKVITSDSTITFNPKESGTYLLRFKLKNDFFESTEYEIIYNIKDKSPTPSISKDSSNVFTSSAQFANQWYLDGKALPDTARKFKPTVQGNYTVKTSQNGCPSDLSANYNFIITSVNEFKNGEYINVYPNPTSDDFIIGYNLIDRNGMVLFAYDANGKLILSQEDILCGSSISLSGKVSGIYLLIFKDKRGNIIYMNKIIKK